MRRPRWLLAAGVALALGLAWGLTRWHRTSGPEQAEITAAVTRAELPVAVTERGELESSRTVDIRCEVEGLQSKIVEILPEGTPVKKGQVVARFDTEQLSRNYAQQEIQLKQAEGKAKAARGELEVQKNKYASELAKAELACVLAQLDLEKYVYGEYQVEVDDRRGAIALAERDLEEAREKLEHYRNFVKKGFGTLEQLRLKEAEVERAGYVLSRDKAKLEVLEKYTRKRQESELKARAKEADQEVIRAKGVQAAAVARAQSDLEAAEVTAELELAQLKGLKKQLERCVVRALQDGILIYSKERVADPSGRIQLGASVHFQQTLFSLPDLTQMQVKVKVHEAVVKKVKPGQKAQVRIDAYAGVLFMGTVESVATLPHSEGFWDNRGVKEYVTIVRLDDPSLDAGLKPGMTAAVKILVNRLPEVLVVPVQAVGEHDGEYYSYVVSPEGLARRRVVIGENNERFVEAKDGLQEGDQVTLDASIRLAAELRAAGRDRATPAASDQPTLGKQ
jgi:HlyD family secretion protein